MSIGIVELSTDHQPLVLKYTMDTQPRLSAREAELTLLSAIDDICFATILSGYDGTINRPVILGKLISTRNSIQVLRITYSNPWELILAIPSTAVATVAFIEALVLLRVKRQKAQADLRIAEAAASSAETGSREKSASSTRRAQAEASKAEADARIAWADVRLREETLDCTIQEKIAGLSRSHPDEKNLDQGQFRQATIASLREKQNELIDDSMAAIMAIQRYNLDHDDIAATLKRIRSNPAGMMDAIINAEDVPFDPDLLLVHNEDLRAQLRQATNNVRLLASYMRLDNVQRQAAAIPEGSQPGHGD